MMDYHNPNDFWRPGDPDLYKDLDDDERIAATICHIVGMVLMFLVVFAVMAMCSSCTTMKYIPVIEHQTDTLIQTKLVHDSIYINDSTVITEKGDTVRIEKWHTKYIEKQVHDTTYVAKHDSIPVPYDVIKEVPRKRSTLDWVLSITGLMAIIGVILWVENKVKRFLPGM